MSEDELEQLLDLFEKEAGKVTTTGMRAELMLPEDKIVPREFPKVRAMVLAASNLQLRGKILEPVYDYWASKRLRLGKALMRQYQEAPPRGNTDPHVAFRLRTEGRRISKRNPRKDDQSGYQKMHYLKRDFVKMLDIIEHVQTREQLKREQALLNIHIFDAKLQATPWGQQLLKQYPAVEQAIATLNAIPPPPSSLAGAPAPSLPPSLATEGDMRLFRLLHSMHPPCSYTRQELDAENRKKKAARGAANASAAAAASVSHKRPNNVITIPRPSDRSSTGGGGGGGHSSSSHKSSSHHHHGGSSSSHHGSSSHESERAQKAARKEARRRERADARASAGGDGSGLMSLDDDGDDDVGATDEEDFLSETEDDRKFYAEVEAYVKLKRLRVMGPSHEAVGAGTGTAGAAVADGKDSTAVAVVPPLSATAHPPQRTHPSGAKVGYMRGAVGRGMRMWIETLVIEAPPQLIQHSPALQQQLHHQQQLAAQAQQQQQHMQQQQQLQQQQQQLQQQQQQQQQQQHHSSHYSQQAPQAVHSHSSSHHSSQSHSSHQVAQHHHAQQQQQQQQQYHAQHSQQQQQHHSSAYAATSAGASAASGSSGVAPMDVSSSMPPAIRAQ